jgi:hypothetical protein
LEANRLRRELDIEAALDRTTVFFKSALSNEAIGEYKGAPLKPIVPSRESAIALPEPDEDDNSDERWPQPRS